VIALRQLVDDRQRALTMSMTDRLVGIGRRVDSLAAALHRTPPTVLLSRQRERMNALERALSDSMARRIRLHRDILTNMSMRLEVRHPRNAIGLTQQHIDALADRLRRAMNATAGRERQRVESLSRYLDSLAPEHVLRRGYSITTRKKDGAIVRTSQDVKPGERIVTRVADGLIESKVDDPKQPRLFE
jgi:exodeoxyribonuclease VII large subunit